MADARWLDLDGVAEHISAQKYAIRRLVKSGRIPPPSYHLGARSPRWDRHAVDAAMARTLQSFPMNSMDAAIEALRERTARQRTRRSGRPQAAR